MVVYFIEGVMDVNNVDWQVADSWYRRGASHDLVSFLNSLYSDATNLHSYSNETFLIYITCLLEHGNIDEAKYYLKIYIDKFGLNEIEDFLRISDFAFKLGYVNENIEKAHFIFNKLKENDKNNLFINYLRGKSIALVGGGPSEVGKAKGCEIDAHDVVIRINDYQTKGYENDYGARTDIHVRNGACYINHYKEYWDNDYKMVIHEPGYCSNARLVEGKLDAIYYDFTKTKSEVCYFNFYDHQAVSILLNGIPSSSGLTCFYKIYSMLGFKNVDVYGFSFLEKSQTSYYHYYKLDDKILEQVANAPHGIQAEKNLMKKLYEQEKQIQTES